MAITLTPRSKWLVRYGAALVAVGAGFLVRQGLTAVAGDGLPTYITFYPVVMAVALLGGIGPGLLATLTTSLAVDYWLIPPTHEFGVARLVDAVGLAFFAGMGVFMSVVAELYRRARQRAAAYDTDILRREGQETQRQAIGETMLLVGGLVLSLALLGAVGWQTYRNLTAEVQADRWVSHTYVVDEELEHLYSTLENMEASERGYLIMGEEDYLRPYNTAKQAVAGQLASLKRLTADNPSQVQRLKDIEALVDTKLAELKEVIEVRRSQGLEAAHNLMVTGKGQTLTEEIRKRVTEAEEEEQRLLQVRTTAKDADLRKTLQALLAGGVLSLLLLTTVFVFLTQENKRRRRAEAELSRHRDRLQELVADRTTALRESNESLRQQREWLKVTLSSIGDAVLATNTAGHITFLNPVAETLTGWPEKEALGQPVQGVFRIINDVTHAPGEDIVTRVLREGKAVALANHTALVTRDGREVAIEDSAAPIKDAAGSVSGVVLVFHDVTEKRRAQTALRETEQRLQLFIEHAPASLAMFDHQMRYLSVSRRWLSDYGLGDRDLRGLSHYDILPEIPERWKAVHRRGLAGEVIQAEADRFDRADGSAQWLRWEVRPWHSADGEVGGIIIFSEDITGRKEAEAEIRRQADELRASNEELTRFNRVTMGRELRIIELKKQVNELCVRLGEPPRYGAGFELEPTRPPI